jgi:hypothetical protein
MKTNKPALTGASAIVLSLLIGSLACNLPAATAPTPFVFPTPDLTLTAIFSVLVTPTAPVLQTATPVQLPTQVTPSLTPTLPPVLGTFFPDTAFPTSTQEQPLATATATQAQVMRPGPEVEAGYMHSRPGIDANLSEWNLTSYNANHITFGADRWDNPEDLSSRFMVGWDFNNLYLAAWVTDEDYVQNAQGQEIFLGDSLEILLDRDLAGDFESQNLSGDDYQLGISPGYTEPGNAPEAYLWHPREKAGIRSDVQVAARRTTTGWEVEAAIPWSVFDLAPREGQAYGFIFSVSDNDRTGHVDQQTMISNVSTRRLGNPTTWGNLVLGRP